MIVVGVDIETTGLDVEKDEITEIGAVLWDTEAKKPLGLFNEFCRGAIGKVSEEITELTGITSDILTAWGKGTADALLAFSRFAEGANALVAHNGSLFDRPFIHNSMKRYGLVPADLGFDWIDTSLDIPYPSKIQTRKLVHLAAEHGFVNPFAHRAVFDVLTMLTVLSQYDFDEVFRLSREPSVLLVAHTTEPWKDGGKSNDEARARGFRWDAAKKQWSKLVKQSQAENAKKYPFAVRVVA